MGKQKQQATTTPAAQTQVVMYTLSASAVQLATTTPNATLQYSSKAHGTGKAWRATGLQKPNLRAGALAALVAAMPNNAPFTLAQAQAAFKTVYLGHGTPGSYTTAFIKNGYFVPQA